MKATRLGAVSLGLCVTALSLLGTGRAHAGMTYGENVPALSVGQTWVYDATPKYADIDGLQLVFMFSSSVGNTFRIQAMPYDATKPEDDTVFRNPWTRAVIDDDGGQNNYSSALWTRTNASNTTGNITNYGFNIEGFSTSLKNLRVAVTRLK